MTADPKDASDSEVHVRRSDLVSSAGYFEEFSVGQRMRHARGATIGEVENNYLTKAVMNTAQGHWNGVPNVIRLWARAGLFLV